MFTPSRQRRSVDRIRGSLADATRRTRTLDAFSVMHTNTVMWPWCIVMSDTRALSTEKDPRSVWSLTARINHAYASLHGYGFAFYQVDGACAHLQQGARDASWCKVVALAHALLHGVQNRRCDRILYLDTDAHVTNETLSVDQYLERARLRGDDALATGADRADDSWLLLFSSNFWFEPDSINAGVFIVRAGVATMQSCGLLRRWWDARFDAQSHLAEQEPMESMYTQLFAGKSSAPGQTPGQRGDDSMTTIPGVTGAEATQRLAHERWHAAWGSQVRLMPTARFFRRSDSQWSGGGWGAWASAGWDHPPQGPPKAPPPWGPPPDGTISSPKRPGWRSSTAKTITSITG